MPHIQAIKALDDNYIWIIHQDAHAIIIDPALSEPVIEYLTAHQLTPIATLITHHHHDHTGGVAALKDSYPQMPVIAHAQHGVTATSYVDEGDKVELMGIDFEVWRTAGHTDTHLSYRCVMNDKVHIFCGDTLFSGGCGRVFTGTMDELYASMMRFNSEAEDTLFYPAHEYTLGNLKFGLSICANAHKNAIIATINDLEHQPIETRISLPTSLQHERHINVFLQLDNAQMIDNIKKIYPLTDDSPLAVFGALRELKNQFK